MKKQFSKKGRQYKKEPKEYEEEVIQIDRVTRVVKGGRRLRFRATVVIGNRKRKVGFGVGKSNEVTGAIQKAVGKAKKNIVVVNLDKNTIPHETKVKFKSAKILLLPASDGTGIIAGGPVRKILELAGVKNVLSKILGTKNKLLNTQATILALEGLRPNPRGKKKDNKKEAKGKDKPKNPKAQVPRKKERKPEAAKPKQKKVESKDKPKKTEEKAKSPKKK